MKPDEPGLAVINQRKGYNKLVARQVIPQAFFKLLHTN